MSNCMNECNPICCSKRAKEDIDEAYQQGRADAIEEFKKLINFYLVDNMQLADATKYGNKNAEQADISYGTLMRYEIANCVEDLLDSLEQLKE